jgi:hypothetical protein
MFKFLLWTFLIIMVFRFLVRFLFPVIQVTRATQSKLRQMQDQMNKMNESQSEPQQAPRSSVKPGDYIDYEEVK